MSATTGIQWTDATWNVVTGCTKVSAGCKNCYAERDFHRPYPGRDFGDIRFHEDRLDHPLRWRKPKRIFVNSLSDLFHERVTDEQIDRVFAVMALAPEHTFQVLTKRPERMRQWFASFRDPAAEARGWNCADWLYSIGRGADCERVVQSRFWNGLPNVWLGVSVEDQATADERIPLLLQTPAAVRFVSAEPLLEEILLDGDEGEWLHVHPVVDDERDGYIGKHESRTRRCDVCNGQPTIDWVIVGGESGPRARPCDVAWIRAIVEQCRAADVACFVKQLGARPFGSFNREGVRYLPLGLRDRKGGEPAEWPEDLRVRQFPQRGARREGA